jgi:hypothetical protein
MKTVQLTHGYVATIDDADHEAVSQHLWHAVVKLRRDGSIKAVYARSTIRREDGRRAKTYLHRFILGVTDPKAGVDHEDHNGLNCQRHNLRPCTHAQNNGNQRKSSSGKSSQWKGVTWDSTRNKWRADIHVAGKTKNLGRFTDDVQAALAYDAAAREHFGEFACCNFPPKMPCQNSVLASMLGVVEVPA